MNHQHTARLTPFNVFAVGLMTFSFFLGAGNIIFPPIVGFSAGENIIAAFLGFAFTAVGLPLLTLWMVAREPEGVTGVMSPLPKPLMLSLIFLIYLLLSPMGATPRACLVAYEMSFAPVVQNDSVGTFVYSAVFFVVVGVLCIRQGQLVDLLGKWVTPVLITLLIGLSVLLIFMPIGEVSETIPDYQQNPFSTGAIAGYGTLDALSALMFGAVTLEILKEKGVHDNQLAHHYLLIAGLIAAFGLLLVYLAFFYLGHTMGGLSATFENGGQMIEYFVQTRLGTMGTVLFALTVTLSCFTTAIGLISAMSDFMKTLLPNVSLTVIVASVTVLSFAVANIGLATLLEITGKILLILYPIGLSLVLSGLLKQFVRIRQTTRFYLAIFVGCIGILDFLLEIGFDPFALNQYPFISDKLFWLAPFSIVMGLEVVYCFFIKKEQESI